MMPASTQRSWQAKEGLTFIHPFNDLTVATGQGTIAMEIVKELPLVDYILVPIGGGGLATGVSTLAKLLNPKIKVIGVEPEGAACMKASLQEGHVVTLPTVNTIADGTAVKTPGDKLFPYLQKNLDDIITISDAEIIGCLPGYGRESQDDRRELRSSDCRSSETSETGRKESCFYPEWR